MGDVPIPPAEEPEDDFAAKLVDLRNRLDDASHVALTGDRATSIRRPALFVIIGVALALGLPILGIPALIALAYTDQVVAL